MDKENNLPYNKILRYILPPCLVIAAFVLWTPNAEASVVVEGSREFRDSVNDCLNTYRNNEGIVGDVIKELEASGNEHKITEGPDWENTPADGTKAMNGTGTGTHSVVSAAELERLKESVDELKNKDFCTALLHEMWHSVDADRGGWSNDQKDGVWEDEIEATMFQNFIHAIRGVDPRTQYGRADISTHLGLVEPVPEATEEAVATPGTESPSEPTEEEETEPAAPSATISYDHVKPGEYSEVYLTVTANPGASVSVKLEGLGVASAADMQVNANDSGVAKFTWKIVSYGTYQVSGTASGQPFSASVIVQ